MSITLQGEAPASKKPPVFVLIIAVAFMAIGLLDFWRGVAPLTGKPAHMAGEDLAVLSIGITALIGSVCVLRGHHWARWLLAAWMALHVALSIQQPYALLAHIVIFGLVLAGLFHPRASRYFRRRER
jgi:hypothetical protein